ncbi:MAG TPA: pyridoxal 5'-phosphate synthase glutaminase subunit PdxT [Acidimicrobiia bacterium]|nr:pyridoxal 5'-phosphate synthase glutaminase subunit PdxT [Acidimicrobiia bacterium]
MKVGVLALQGAFREHRELLDGLDVDTVEVRSPAGLAALDALILPGGESTTIGKLLVTSGLLPSLQERIRDGLAVLGTCAGVILLATDVLDGRPDQPSLAALDVTVRRNGYGTQLQSFEADLAVAGLTGPFPGVFIRAPQLERTGPEVEVLARHDGRPVLCRQGPIWGATFHPELSGDLRVHEQFLQSVAAR